MEEFSKGSSLISHYMASPFFVNSLYLPWQRITRIHQSLAPYGYQVVPGSPLAGKKKKLTLREMSTMTIMHATFHVWLVNKNGWLTLPYESTVIIVFSGSGLDALLALHSEVVKVVFGS